MTAKKKILGLNTEELSSAVRDAVVKSVKKEEKKKPLFKGEVIQLPTEKKKGRGRPPGSVGTKKKAGIKKTTTKKVLPSKKNKKEVVSKSKVKPEKELTKRQQENQLIKAQEQTGVFLKDVLNPLYNLQREILDMYNNATEEDSTSYELINLVKNLKEIIANAKEYNSVIQTEIYDLLRKVRQQ